LIGGIVSFQRGDLLLFLAFLLLLFLAFLVLVHQLVQLHQAVLLLAIVLVHSILLLLLVVWLVPSLLEWLVVSLIETSNDVCHRRVEVGIRVMGACGGSATSVGDVTAFVLEVSISGGGTRGSSKVSLVLRLLGVSG
jgi:hypothetical protein